MVFHGRYKSREEKKAAEKARVEKRKQLRAEAKKKTNAKTRHMLAELHIAMDMAGLTKTEMSEFSGLSPGTLIHIDNTRHTSIRLSSYIAVANACGYEVKLVAKPEKMDEFLEFRKVRRGDLEE